MAQSPYDELGPPPDNRPSRPLDVETSTQSPYVTILPHATGPVTDNCSSGEHAMLALRQEFKLCNLTRYRKSEHG